MAGYGSPGHHFAGRKNMQQPGGNSSLSLGDGSNYSPYAPRWPAVGSYNSPPPQQQPASSYASPYGASPYGGVPQYGAPSPMSGPTDYSLASQLNLPQGSRRPPSAGRRAPGAMPQPSYQQHSSPVGPSGGYFGSPPSWQKSGGMQGGGSILGNAGGGYNAYSNSPTFGAGPSGYGSPQGSSLPVGNGYGSYGGGMPGMPAIPRPVAAQGGPSFHAGQKGAFCGKVSMQPPGGRQTINIFGGY